MRRKCPECGKMPEIPESGGYCRHCGAYIPGRGSPPVSQTGPRPAADGCPWEKMDELGFFRALWETISGVLFNPNRFFSTMPISGGIGKPLLFGLLVGSVGSIISLLWQSSRAFFPYWLSRYPGFEEFPGGAFAPYWMSGPAFTIVMIFLTPLLILVGIFISSAITHLCLMLIGGAKSGYEATLRVVAYANATSVVTIFPFCGGVISLFWSVVVTIIGLKEAHRISTGKAAAAFFLPLVFCCGLLFFLLMAFGLISYFDFIP